MGLITKFHTFSDGYIPSGLINAERLNTNWDRLYTLVNGELDQDNIASDFWLVSVLATRPTWSSAYEGMIVYAEDTLLLSYATDSQWVDLLSSVHAATHMASGSDEILLDELGIPTDVTTLNATNARHGLLPKLSNTSTEYLNGVGGWVNPKLDDLSATDDNTDLNASASAHGLLPKLSNVASQYLDGTGSWSTPLTTTLRVVADSGSPQVTTYNDTDRNQTAASYTVIKEIKVNEALEGTLYMQWQFVTSVYGREVRTQAAVNGSGVGSEFNNTDDGTPSAGNATLTGPFSVDDLIQIRGYYTGSSAACHVSQQQLLYNWAINSLDGYVLGAALEIINTSEIDHTNQDPT